MATTFQTPRAHPLPPPRPPVRPGLAPTSLPPVHGFFLFLILNATLFVRPSEIFPALLGWHIYLVLISLCLLLALPAVLEQLSGKSLGNRPITVCVLALLVFTVLASLAHMEFAKAATHGFEFVKVVLYFLLLVAVVNTPARLRTFVLSFGVFCAAVTGLAVLYYHGYIQLASISVLKDALYDPITQAKIVVPRLRGTGVFDDPNDLCLMLVLGAMISLYGLSDRRLGPLRIFWVATLLLFAYALYLTKSRGGFLGMLVALMTFLTARYGWKRSLLLAGILLPVLFVFFAGRQTDISASGTTGQSRIQLWSDGLVMIKGNPLFGVGMDEYANDAGQVAHNGFLHVFAELGFLAGVLFLGAFYYALTSLRRLGTAPHVVLDPGLRRLRPYLTAMVAGYATGMLTLSVCYIVPTYTILGLASVYLRLAAAHPPLPVRRFDGRLFQRMVLVGIVFLAAVYVFVRLFLRW